MNYCGKELLRSSGFELRIFTGTKTPAVWTKIWLLVDLLRYDPFSIFYLVQFFRFSNMRFMYASGLLKMSEWFLIAFSCIFFIMISWVWKQTKRKILFFAYFEWSFWINVKWVTSYITLLYQLFCKDLQLQRSQIHTTHVSFKRKSHCLKIIGKVSFNIY